MNDIYFKKVSALESQKLLFKIISLSDSTIKYLDDGVGLKGKGKEKFNALSDSGTYTQGKKYYEYEYKIDGRRFYTSVFELPDEWYYVENRKDRYLCDQLEGLYICLVLLDL